MSLVEENKKNRHSKKKFLVYSSIYGVSSFGTLKTVELPKVNQSYLKVNV